MKTNRQKIISTSYLKGKCDKIKSLMCSYYCQLRMILENVTTKRKLPSSSECREFL